MPITTDNGGFNFYIMYDIYLTKKDKQKFFKLQKKSDYKGLLKLADKFCPNFDQFINDVSLYKLVKYAIFEYLESKTIYDDSYLNRKNELSVFFVQNKISNGPIKEYPIFYQVSKCFEIKVVKSRREQRILNGVYVIPDHVDTFLREHIREWMSVNYVPVKEFNRIYEDFCLREGLVMESKERLNDAVEEFCMKYNGHFERSKQHKIDGVNMRCKYFKKL